MDPHNDLRKLLEKIGIVMSNDDFKKFIEEEGKKLRASRIARKLEIETVSRQVEIPLNVMHQIERGECVWATELIARLQSYYDSIPAPKRRRRAIIESNVIYTDGLTEKLNQVLATAKEFAKPNPDKTLEQFLAEINFIVMLLKEIRYDACSYS